MGSYSPSIMPAQVWASPWLSVVPCVPADTQLLCRSQSLHLLAEQCFAYETYILWSQSCILLSTRAGKELWVQNELTLPLLPLPKQCQIALQSHRADSAARCEWCCLLGWRGAESGACAGRGGGTGSAEDFSGPACTAAQAVPAKMRGWVCTSHCPHWPGQDCPEQR